MGRPLAIFAVDAAPLPRPVEAAPTRPESLVVKRALLGLAWIALASCGGAPQEPAPVATLPPLEYPAGTLLTVNGEVLMAAEVEPLASAIEELFPEYSRTHARRLALTGEYLPVLAGRALAPEAWRAARAASAAFDPSTPPEPLRTRGNFSSLGLGLWNGARGLAPGAWSAPLELFGRFVRLRLDGRVAAEDPRAVQLEVSVVEFPYLEARRARELLEEALDRAELVIVDPAWREAVPEAWQHRMRSERP